MCNINKDFSFLRMSFAIKQVPSRAMNGGIFHSLLPRLSAPCSIVRSTNLATSYNSLKEKTRHYVKAAHLLLTVY